MKMKAVNIFHKKLHLKQRFLLLLLSKYYQILQKHPFWIGYSDILSKLPAVIYPLCFKKQTLEVLLHLS